MCWYPNLYVNLNVHVAVNVNTKPASATFSTMARAAVSKNSTGSGTAYHSSMAAQTVSTYVIVKNLQQNMHRRAYAGISSFLLINSLCALLLFLLTLCSDGCRAHEFSVTATGARNTPIHSNLTALFNKLTPAGLDDDSATDAAIANVTAVCLQRCSAEENSFQDGFGIKCAAEDSSEKCFKSRCSKGCEQWWHSFKEFEPCEEACYLALMGVVQSTAPQVLTENIMENSLALKWSITLPHNYLASRPFQLQYRYAGHANGSGHNLPDSLQQWYNVADYSCSEQFHCEILDGLMPFTSYRFRFGLHFADESLYSPATAVFKTSAAGAPISRPLIQHTLAMDDSHVALFWQPGINVNGPLLGYKLMLHNLQLNATVEMLLPAHVQHYIFSHLHPSTNYTLRVSMWNSEGDGPYEETSVVTKDLIKSSTEELKTVLIAGEYNIKLKTLQPLTETNVVYQSEELLNDYALHMSAQRLFAVDADGVIYSLVLDNSVERALVQLDKSALNFRPARVAVDWLNQKLFIAGESPAKCWTIASIDLEGSSMELIVTNITTAIKQLEADPVNGWLFWTHNNGLTRMNLHTKVVDAPYKTKDIAYFNNDFRRFLLIAFNRSDNYYYELSYDGTYSQRLQFSNTRHDEVLSFSYADGTMLATNGTHLLQQNYQTNENDNWLIKDVEWCWSALPLQKQQQLQPVPVPYASPGHLQALLTSNMAKISWKAPERTHFQSQDAWQQWDYELEIMDVASNSAFNIRNIKTTFFNVEKLQANNLHKLRVRAASRSAVSAWSAELMTRTWPLGAHSFTWAGAAGVYETNEIGVRVERVAQLEGGVRDFVQLNGTIYYITQDERLLCAYLMTPEINCTFAATNAVSVAYDWRGGKLYWADRYRNCVIRANLDGTAKELLQVFDAVDIEIDSYNGHIYYTTGQLLARRTLSGMFETEEVEYFHVSDFGGQIRGFALDAGQAQLYWVVRQHEGQARLFKTSLDRTTPPHKLVAYKLLENDIRLGTLQYLHDIESLLWVEANQRQVVLLRTDKYKAQAAIALPELPEISQVQLQPQYTPYMDASVIPAAINVSSIRIDDGYWDDFNIKWNAITTAENYTVFYKVLLQYGGDQQKWRYSTMEVSEPYIRITEFHHPQLLLDISITPHTYWQAGATVHTQLSTPAAAPAQPKRLRIFVQRLPQPLQQPATEDVSVLVRWDPPENVSSNAEVFYKVFCWLGEDLVAENLHNFSSEGNLEAAVNGLHVGETYTFQVQAFAAGRLSGGEKTAFHALHINPDVQTLPRLLYTTSEFIAEMDLDLNERRVLVHTSSEVEHLVVLQAEERLLWVNDNVELLSYVPNSTPIKLARMRAEVLSLTVDWIERIVYWAELDTDTDQQAVSIYKLDLCQFEGRVTTGSKIISTEQGRFVRDLLVLPFSQTLLWLEHELGERNATLVGRNLSDIRVVKHKSVGLLRMFEGALTAELETVHLVDFKGKICTYDVHRHMCTPLKTHFNTVADGIAQIQRDSGYIYTLKNDSIHAYSRRKQNLEYSLNMADVRKIKAYNYQQYPEQKCMLPAAEEPMLHQANLKAQVAVLAEDFITLSMPLLNTDEDCWLDVPGVRYSLDVSGAGNYTRSFISYERSVNITKLLPFTNYTIELSATSYYQQKLTLPPLSANEFVVRTAIGTPTAPQNFTAYALSPTEIEVSWTEPAELHSDKIWYQLHWQMEYSVLAAHKTLERNQTAVTLSNLEPAQLYDIWVQVFSSEHKFNTTEHAEVLTNVRPEPLKLLNRSPYNFTFSWPLTPKLSSAVLVCYAVNGDNEFSLDITRNSSYIVVGDLEPKTRYAFYLELSYDGVTRPYVWPAMHNERFVYETFGDTPSSPGQPQIELITGEIFKVFWEPARNNGAPIVEYSLEALQSRGTRRVRRDLEAEPAMLNRTILFLAQLPWAEEPQVIEDTWIEFCNTTELSCIVRELYTLRLLMFRVRARNIPYGWGPYSEESERVEEPFVTSEKRNSLVFAIIAPAAIVSSCVIVFLLVRMVQNRRLKSQKLLDKSRASIWSNLSVLQQQQLMASHNRAFSVASHATLYTGGPLSDADIALLPHVNWNQITLLNFLGSGAFGEVYEGLVKHEDEEKPEKVAIKSLRKGASEFAELLQEAQLMSNFKHENIVRLIGVCFDTESVSIIMEFMEGGDLLTYLRESRPHSQKPFASLQLIDLLTMCIDVATGCSYLEDMHFVHRDLACRNCLVSSLVPSKRTVKIGDFGLARDIYKHDYYRKEGEGLMPVRWMSPESLMDGVFTIQSDVWAFGVLCWEILTLGQQPYAARNNFDVLSYVKEGGRLEQPVNCPDKLFSLLMECWDANAEERPTFRKCLDVLLSIKTDVRRINMGYNLDESDYALYANQNGLVLTSFLANTLPKVVEENDAEDDCAVSVDSSQESSVLKVRFEEAPKGRSTADSASDELQLISYEPQREEKSVNLVEGISRL